MPSRSAPLRPMSRMLKLLRQDRQPFQPRTLATAVTSTPNTSSPSDFLSTRPPVTLPDPSRRLRSPHRIHHDPGFEYTNRIRTYPPPPSAAKAFKTPVTDFNTSQVSLLDPTGTRTHLFSPSNPDRIRVGDMVHCTFRDSSSPPFNGVILALKQRAQDSAMLLRNRLSPPENTGVEMWVKIYSPNLKSVELVLRAQKWMKRGKMARRSKIYYMRDGKQHPMPNVEGEVRTYLKRRRQILGAGAGDSGQQGRGKGGKKGRR